MKKRSEPHPMSIGGRARSIAHALRGIRVLIVTQPNAMLHVVTAVAVVALGLFFGLSLIEWALVAVSIAAVLASEAFNTALEFLADAVQPDHDTLIGRAKDLAAGAVLLTSLGAAAVGLLIFLPHVLRMVRG